MAKPLLPQEVWNVVQPLLPPRPPTQKGGRPPLGDQEVLTGILFVLRTGIAWVDLPEEMGCGSGMTCLRRLRSWQRRGVWDRIQAVLAKHLGKNRPIDWSRAQRTRAEAGEDPLDGGMARQYGHQEMEMSHRLSSTSVGGGPGEGVER